MLSVDFPEDNQLGSERIRERPDERIQLDLPLFGLYIQFVATFCAVLNDSLHPFRRRLALPPFAAMYSTVSSPHMGKRRKNPFCMLAVEGGADYGADLQLHGDVDLASTGKLVEQSAENAWVASLPIGIRLMVCCGDLALRSADPPPKARRTTVQLVAYRRLGVIPRFARRAF